MTTTSALAACLPLCLIGQAQKDGPAKTFEPFGPAHQMIFFSVLEGLYEDGVTTDEVKQILMKRPEHGYEHFIYSCPLCTAAFQAFEVYLNRPKFWMYKGHSIDPKHYEGKEESVVNGHHREYYATFGDGLSRDVREALASDETIVRLKTIFDLVGAWIARRMQKMNLPAEQKNAILEEIRDGRLKGIKALEGFKRKPESMKAFAPGYIDLDECAICNASANMAFSE